MTETVQDYTLDEYFAKLPARVRPENLAGLTSSYLFDIKDAGCWRVAVEGSALNVEQGDGDADVRIAMSEPVFRKLIAGEQNPMRAVMTGKIKVKGDRAAAAKLQKILVSPEGDAAPAGPPPASMFQQVLRARHGSLSATDRDALAGLLDDAVVWHDTVDGDLRGKDAVIAAWTSGDAGTLDDTVYTDGIHAVGFATVGGTRQATVMHVDENGRVTEIWAIPSDRQLAAGATAEHPVIPVFRGAQEARMRSEFGPEDTAAFEAFFDPSVTWHMGGRTGWAQEKEGLDQIIGTFKALKQATGGTFAVEVLELFADDEHALGRSHLTADRPDRPDKHMDVIEVSLFHLRDGRAYEFWGIPEDEEKRDSFWMD